MSASHSEKYAFEYAKEIVIATCQNNKSIEPVKEHGIHVGEYFEEIYKKLLEISKAIHD